MRLYRLRVRFVCVLRALEELVATFEAGPISNGLRLSLGLIEIESDSELSTVNRSAEFETRIKVAQVNLLRASQLAQQPQTQPQTQLQSRQQPTANRTCHFRRPNASLPTNCRSLAPKQVTSADESVNEACHKSRPLISFACLAASQSLGLVSTSRRVEYSTIRLFDHSTRRLQFCARRIRNRKWAPVSLARIYGASVFSVSEAQFKSSLFVVGDI